MIIGALLIGGGIVACIFMCRKANEYTRAQMNVRIDYDHFKRK